MKLQNSLLFPEITKNQNVIDTKWGKLGYKFAYPSGIGHS